MRSINKIFIAIFLIVAASTANLNAQVPTCAACGEELGAVSYKTVHGKFYHPEHFVCGHCRKPIKNEFYEKDGVYYDPACYREQHLPRCAHCDKPIDDTYTVYQDKPYHSTCFENRIAPRCEVCNAAIYDSYFTDFWGNNYHKEHADSHPNCSFCQRLVCEQITQGGRMLPNGEHICNICVDSAVTEYSIAEKLLHEAKHRLEGTGILIDHGDIRLHLLPWNEFYRILPAWGEDHTGFTKYEFTEREGKIVEKSFNIYILSGMPKYHYVSTAAHELMHVWQHLYCYTQPAPIVREGSCNFAASLVLKQYENRDALYVLDGMAKNTDPVYGDGYRKIRRVVDNLGLQTWLDHLAAGRIK